MNREERRQRQRVAPQQVAELSEFITQQAAAQTAALSAAHEIIEMQRTAIMRVRDLCNNRVEELTGGTLNLDGTGATLFVTDVLKALDGDTE